MFAALSLVFLKTEDWLGCPLLVDGSVCVRSWWVSNKVVCNGVPMVRC